MGDFMRGGGNCGCVSVLKRLIENSIAEIPETANE